MEFSGLEISKFWFFTCLLISFFPLYLYYVHWDTRLSLKDHWYFIPEIIFATAISTRVIVSILASIKKKPGCDCFQAAALYVDAGVSIPAVPVLLSRCPRFFGYFMITFSILGGMIMLGGQVFSIGKSLRIGALNSLVLGAFLLGYLQISHFICRIYYARLMNAWLLRRIDQLPMMDLEDVVVQRPRVDLSTFQTRLTVLMHASSADCVICSEAFTLDEQVTLLPCAHFFHQTCAEAWLCRVSSCPLCRRPVSLSPLR